VQVDAGLDITLSEYHKKLKPGLMHVVYEWCNGVSFAEICQLTDVQEGSIVRHIIRLEETAREFRSIARVLGDSRLFEGKFEQRTRVCVR
jgi:antiviral helicase SKI2